MANKQMQRCLTSIIKEMQIKTIIGYHFTPIRMATKKRKKKMEMSIGEDMGKLVLAICWWDCKTVQLL